MTKPGDPQKGKAAEAEQVEQAAQESAAATSQAAAEQAAEATGHEPEPSAGADPSAPAQAEGTAAETTGVDKAGAEAAAVTEPAGDEPGAEPAAKPRRTRARKPAAEKPAAEAPAEPEPPAEPAPKAAPARRRDAGEAVIVRAQARYVRSSARKARLVCDHIRGKSVAEARAILAFSPRQVSEAWTKLLESAVANAENNHDLNGEDLKVHAVYADEGPTIKRFRPRAMGRATRIRKRTSHLTIQLTPMATPQKAPASGRRKRSR